MNTNSTPLTSGKRWERIPTGGTHRGVNDGFVVWNEDDHAEKAYFKFPTGDPRSSMYSLGVERVAFTIASALGMPIMPTYLEVVEGQQGLLVDHLPGGKTWFQLDSDLLEGVRFVDKGDWASYMALDVLLGNNDRHRDNIYVQWDPPHQRRPDDDEVCTIWLFDQGYSGLWSPVKFKDGLTGADLESLDPDADLKPAAIEEYRNGLPSQFRQIWMTADRTEVVDAFGGMTDDHIEAAVREIPPDYISPKAADLTVRFLTGRLGRLDKLLDGVFPV